VEAADRHSLLEKGGPFTVFIPTNGAFGRLSPTELKNLIQDKELLSRIIDYHIIRGTYLRSDFELLDKIETLSGDSVEISSPIGNRINDAMIEKVDVECANGIIHVIDTVLLPPVIQKSFRTETNTDQGNNGLEEPYSGEPGKFFANNDSE